MLWCKQACLVFPVSCMARYLPYRFEKKKRWSHQIFLIYTFVIRVVTCTRRVRGVGWMSACGGKVVPPPPWLTSRLPCRTTEKNPPHSHPLPQTPPHLLTVATAITAPSMRQAQTVQHYVAFRRLCKMFGRTKPWFRPWPKYSRSTKRGSGLRQNHSKHCWPTSKHWHWGSMQRKGNIQYSLL